MKSTDIFFNITIFFCPSVSASVLSKLYKTPLALMFPTWVLPSFYTHTHTLTHTVSLVSLDCIPRRPGEPGLIRSEFKALISHHFCSERTSPAPAGKLHPCHWHYLKPSCCVCAKLSSLGSRTRAVCVCMDIMSDFVSFWHFLHVWAAKSTSSFVSTELHVNFKA